MQELENIHNNNGSDQMMRIHEPQMQTIEMTERATFSFHEEIKQKDAEIEDQKKTIRQLQDAVEYYKKKVSSLEEQIMDQKIDSDQDIQNPNQQSKGQSRYWTAEEHQKFLEAIRKYGDKDVRSIAAYVGSRNATQVRTHGQKYYLRLEREKRKKDEIQPMDSNPNQKNFLQ